jgi:hypothetical protein
MKTKAKVQVKALSAEAIIDNARERFSDIEQYVNANAQLIQEQHVLIEEADN